MNIKQKAFLPQFLDTRYKINIFKLIKLVSLSRKRMSDFSQILYTTSLQTAKSGNVKLYWIMVFILLERFESSHVAMT